MGHRTSEGKLPGILTAAKKTGSDPGSCVLRRIDLLGDSRVSVLVRRTEGAGPRNVSGFPVRHGVVFHFSGWARAPAPESQQPAAGGAYGQQESIQPTAATCASRRRTPTASPD